MSKGKYEGCVLNERYQLVRQLDEGNFGAVYEAQDSKLDRSVAVKILFDTGEAAFRKEARLAVRFEHPNVVQVFDYGADEKLKCGYIVMEFLRGRRLDQLITSYSCRLPELLIRKFIDQIGAALHSAHERHLIHRDLKPHNVMLVGEKTLQERFVLLDLGLASQVNVSTTLRNRTLDGAMSPRYASPEQLSSGTVGYLSDIYSFGTIVYELFAGEVPFPRDQLLGLMMAICKEPPPPMSQFAPDREIPPGVEEIVLQCLAKQPDERPASMSDVREALLRVLTDAYGAPPPGSGTDRPLSGSGRMPAGSGNPEALDEQLFGTQRPPDTREFAVPAAGQKSKPPDRETAPRQRAGIPGMGSRRRTMEPDPAWRPRRKSGTALTVTLLITAIVATSYSVWKSFSGGTAATGAGIGTQGAGALPVPPLMPKLVMAGQLTVDSGATARLQLYADVPPAADGKEVLLEASVEELPDWLTVRIPERLKVSELNEIEVTVARLLDDQHAQVPFHVRAGNWNETRVVTVTGIAARAQPLPESFGPVPGAERTSVRGDDRVFHQRIVRRLPSGLEVPFVFIDPFEYDTGESRVGNPFYVQETEVSNALFREYLESLGESDGSLDRSQLEAEWRKGASAGNEFLDAIDHPELPAVGITPVIAHRFAVWLCGSSRGHLPSVDQWDTASGLHQFPSIAERDASEFSEGPFRGNWDPGAGDISVGRRTAGPRAVGTSRNDIGPLGGRDFAGNVREMTETMMNGARLGELADVPAASPLLRVVLRGHSYLNEAPLRWQDLEEQTDVPDALGFDERDLSVGFRVVLEMPR